MKKKILSVLLSMALILIVLSGCSESGGSKSSSSSQSSSGVTSNSSSSSTKASVDHAAQSSANEASQTAPYSSNSSPSDTSQSRMVIYHAELSVTVPKLTGFVSDIETQAKQDGGYVLDMTQNKTNEHLQSSMTLRVPQKDFYHFLKGVEKASGKVLHKSIQGQNVTKQYVDLSSRLKAKELVKARLTSYLNKAKTTKDLLDISNQLGNVQEAIEQIQGQMHYYKNQSDLSTITINVTEEVVAKIDTTHLNTWQKSKGLFKSSVNGIVNFFSGLTVFIIGFSPVLVILLIIVLIGYFIFKKRKKAGNNK